MGDSENTYRIQGGGAQVPWDTASAQPKPGETAARTRSPASTSSSGCIASGGHGSVYEAEHRILGRRAAVKVLHAHLADQGEMLQRFVREARIVNQIHHPNVVDVYDFGMMPDGSPYYVMELLEGRTLSQLVHERGRMSRRAGAGLPGAGVRGAGGGPPRRHRPPGLEGQQRDGGGGRGAAPGEAAGLRHRQGDAAGGRARRG